MKSVFNELLRRFRNTLFRLKVPKYIILEPFTLFIKENYVRFRNTTFNQQVQR